MSENRPTEPDEDEPKPVSLSSLWLDEPPQDQLSLSEEADTWDDWFRTL